MSRGHKMLRAGATALLAAALPLSALLPSPALADASSASRPSAATGTIVPLPDLTTTSAGEPLLYPDTPNPVVKSDILTIPPGGVTQWMTHPVPAYLYVLQGDLTVQFADGRQQTFHQGQSFLQSQTQWHRGRNDGQQQVRFLAVFLDAKGIPVILHPPVVR
jgi:quercetin dioxygenase-like cupin family protein